MTFCIRLRVTPLDDRTVPAPVITAAAIPDADGWGEIAEYRRTKGDGFRRVPELPGGIPRHDRSRRVFARGKSNRNDPAAARLDTVRASAG